MRTVIFSGLLCFVVAASTAQTSSLPNWVIDSLIFETKVSRKCMVSIDTLQDEINKLGRELVANGKALTLSQQSNETLSALLNNSKDANEILSMQFQKDLNTEKKKMKRWRRLAVIETVAIVIGFIVLL